MNIMFVFFLVGFVDPAVRVTKAHLFNDQINQVLV